MISPFRLVSLLLLSLLVVAYSLSAQTTKEKVSGNLIIFHAGSLSVPLKEIGDAFNRQYPEVKLLMESAGSVASARKITDLNRPCDIMASADYAVIDKMLIPKYADWNLKFATNELAVVYSEKSRYASTINARNWKEILLKTDVAFGRADPNSDPCGYRTVMMLQLAEKYYRQPELASRYLAKDNNYMRPKEVDLVALLESGSIDYVFLYRSVAIQHGLKYVVLPDEINLKNPAFARTYASASVEINGKEPGSREIMKGEPMIYGITVLRDAPNRKAAVAFLDFMLSREKGMAILEKDGQPSIIPMPTRNYEKLPAKLQRYALPGK